MGKLPSFQFYPGDWLRDSVAGCSLAAQGLWLRMMFVMHDSPRYGYLCNSDGSPIPPGSVALRCGCTLEQYETLLHELELADVPSRTTEGVICSRRMVRDAIKRAKDADRQAKHRDAGLQTPDAGAIRTDKFTFPQDNHFSHASVTRLSQRSSSSSSNLKKENTAQNRARSPSVLQGEKYKAEHSRRQAAKQQRLALERRGIPRDRRYDGELKRKRENKAIDEEIARVARERQLPQPMTEAQLEARRRELKRQADEIMRSA